MYLGEIYSQIHMPILFKVSTNLVGPPYKIIWLSS